jgi:hypothetical protein
VCVLPVFAQTTWNSSKIEKYNGYDYELWNQDNKGTVSMTLNGDNGSGANAKGGTFTAQWSGTCNVLFRSGKKWGTSSTQNHTAIGQMTVDFAATWSSSDDVRYLGLYGWAYFVSGKIPTKRENGSSANFSNQIEWYIIQDRGSYNPTTSSDCKTYGNGATINGIAYDFKVCDRIGQPMLTGNGNFKQFFSIPKNTSSHRQSGVVDVSAHFNAWHSAGMYMDGPLYEVAMKIESYKCNNGQAQGSGSGSVTKNILTIGGSAPPTTPSSSGTGGGGTSSSSAAKTQATTCKTPLITYPPSSVPADPYTACFKYTDGKCYVCKIESEGEFEGNMNTCSSGWVWDGSQIDNNLRDGYWYQEVTCPAGSSSSSTAASSSSRASSSSSASSSSARSSSSAISASSSSTGSVSSSSEETTKLVFSKTPLIHFSVRANGKALLVEASSPATVEIYNMRGHKTTTFNVSNTSQTVNLSLPSGVYFAKVRGASMQYVRFVLK